MPLYNRHAMSHQQSLPMIVWPWETWIWIYAYLLRSRHYNNTCCAILMTTLCHIGAPSNRGVRLRIVTT